MNPSFHFLSTRYGFTLMEMVLTIALSVSLLSGGYFVTIYTLQHIHFLSAKQVLRRELVLARSFSLTNTQDANWGIFILPNQIIRFRGNSYAARDPVFDTISTISSSVSIDSTGEVIFTRPEGIPLNARIITLTSGTRHSTTTVNTIGAINEE